MKATYALYSDPTAVQEAVDRLKAAEVNERDIVIMSSEPMEHHEFAERDQKTSMSGIAVLGGFGGLLFGASLTSVTQSLWPLNTGGMPIVTLWPNLIITFEMTMLGAILATVATLVLSARLGHRLPDLYDPEVSNGKILVGIVEPSESQLSALRSALGAGELKTIP